MSCVGTRPPLLQEVQMYRNHHHARLSNLGKRDREFGYRYDL